MRNLLLAIVLLSSTTCSPALASLALDKRFGFSNREILFRRDNEILSREKLVGTTAVLQAQDGQPALEIRFDEFYEARDFSDVPVSFYRLSARLLGTAEFKSLCFEDAEGREIVVAILDEKERPSLTCTSGAEGKYILFGYRPWETKDGLPLREAHLACVRMVRADYGGDISSYTKEGMLIAFRDRFEIREFPKDNTMALEAVWGPEGALCVAHTRVGEIVSLEELGRLYPHLVGHLGPSACNDSAVAGNPAAILFNRSAINPPPSR
jgi:hypothetical protein